MSRYPMLAWVDGTEDAVQVVADMRDVSAWEKARHERQWPPTPQATTLAARYMAWHALRRLQYPGTPAVWDDDWVVSAQDEGAPEPEVPTQPGPGPG